MNDRTQVRLSPQCRAILERWKASKQIGDMLDGYRLGIAVALAVGQEPTEMPQNSVTYISASTLDPDGEIRVVVKLLSGDTEHGEYYLCELLADQGVKYLNDKFPDGRIDFGRLLPE